VLLRILSEVQTGELMETITQNSALSDIREYQIQKYFLICFVSKSLSRMRRRIRLLRIDGGG